VKRKILFVGDGGQSSCLDNLLESRSISITYRVKRLSLQLGIIRRHLGYMQLATQAVLSRYRYDAVFIWQQYVAIYYWLFSLMFPFNARPTLVYYIIFKNSKIHYLTRIKRQLMLRMTCSRQIHKVFFTSTSDALYPFVPQERKSVINSFYMRSEYIEQNLSAQKLGGRHWFSGGASNRDYAELKHLATAMPQDRFLIACLPHTVSELAPLPSNLIAHTDAYGDTFESLLLNARAVILPLIDPDVMSGQLVCLQAMQAAKPIFIKTNNFLAEWLGDIDQLDFIVMYQDLDDLLSKLANFSVKDLDAMGTKGRNFFFEHFSEEQFYGLIADEIFAVRDNLA